MNQEILDLINRRERQMLIHSYMYYKRDYCVWTDAVFDATARELASLIIDYPEEAAKAEWAKYFKEWDGSTGFHLPLTHPWVVMRGDYMVNLFQKKYGGKNG